jgi:predicted permease
MAVFRRVTNLFRRSRLDSEIAAEIQAHIDLRTEDNIVRGMPPAEAHREARMQFGNPTATRERVTAADSILSVETLGRDLRLSLRQLKRTPGFTVTAILTLAIGIGGVTAAYSVVEGVLLRPLSFDQPERLVRLHEGVEHQFEQGDLPAPDVIRFVRDNRAFQQVAGFVGAEFELSGAGKPFQARAERITSSLLPMLGAKPVLGRTFTAREDEDSSPVAIISNAVWRERFHSDAGAIGSTIGLDRRPYTIVGVMPAGFEFPLSAGRMSRRDLWVPMSFTPDEKQDETDNFQYGAIARLRAGVTLVQAQADVQRMVAAVEAEIPPQFGIHLTSNVRLLQEETVHRAQPLLLALWAASALILLIASANLANLQLVRAAGRQREFGVRAALGAARITIIRQLVTESLVLSTIGGVLGTVLAVAVSRVAVVWLPESLPRANEIAVRWPVLLMALGLTCITGILCGLVPGLASIKTDVMNALKESARGAGSGRSHHRVRGALAAVEVALAMLLLVASGLFLRSFAKMLATDPGFQADHVLTGSLTLPEHGYQSQQSVDVFFGELLRRAAALPEVKSVGAVSNLPIIGINSDRNFVPQGYSPRNGRTWISASNYFVLGRYFQAMRIPLVEGRYLTAADDKPDAPLVAVVSQSTARAAWPGIDPIGRHFRMGGNPNSTRPLITVVGVVGDVRQGALDQSVYPQMYEPFQQSKRQFEPAVQASIGAYRSLYVVLNSTGEPLLLQASLEKTVHQLDPLLALAEVHTMDSIVSATQTSRRFDSGTLAAFAFIALALALLGIYGVMAHSVSERAREIAIRMALGATRREVLHRVLRNALKLALIGIAAGLVASVVFTRFLTTLLYGVKPLDAVTLAGAVVLLLACSALAGWIPARRAAGIDPMHALRGE